MTHPKPPLPLSAILAASESNLIKLYRRRVQELPQRLPVEEWPEVRAGLAQVVAECATAYAAITAQYDPFHPSTPPETRLAFERFRDMCYPLAEIRRVLESPAFQKDFYLVNYRKVLKLARQAFRQAGWTADDAEWFKELASCPDAELSATQRRAKRRLHLKREALGIPSSAASVARELWSDADDLEFRRLVGMPIMMLSDSEWETLRGLRRRRRALRLLPAGPQVWTPLDEVSYRSLIAGILPPSREEALSELRKKRSASRLPSLSRRALEEQDRSATLDLEPPSDPIHRSEFYRIYISRLASGVVMPSLTVEPPPGVRAILEDLAAHPPAPRPPPEPKYSPADEEAWNAFQARETLPKYGDPDYAEFCRLKNRRRAAGLSLQRVKPLPPPKPPAAPAAANAAADEAAWAAFQARVVLPQYGDPDYTEFYRLKTRRRAAGLPTERIKPLSAPAAANAAADEAAWAAFQARAVLPQYGDPDYSEFYRLKTRRRAAGLPTERIKPLPAPATAAADEAAWAAFQARVVLPQYGDPDYAEFYRLRARRRAAGLSTTREKASVPTPASPRSPRDPRHQSWSEADEAAWNAFLARETLPKFGHPDFSEFARLRYRRKRCGLPDPPPRPRGPKPRAKPAPVRRAEPTPEEREARWAYLYSPGRARSADEQREYAALRIWRVRHGLPVNPPAPTLPPVRPLPGPGSEN